MGTVDDILNWLVPIIIILVFAGILYTKMKAPIDQVLSWISKLFRKGIDKVQEQEYETVYKYS